MLKQLDIGMVIGMKQAGMSNRAIHKAKGYDRQRISRVWSDYNAALAQMEDPDADIKTVQEKMYSEPKYDSSKRTRRKYTQEVEEALQEILKQEAASMKSKFPCNFRDAYPTLQHGFKSYSIIPGEVIVFLPHSVNLLL